MVKPVLKEAPTKLVRQCVKLYHRNPNVLHLVGDTCACVVVATTVTPLLALVIIVALAAAIMLFA